MLSLSDAVARVQRQCAFDVDPVLTPTEIEQILIDQAGVTTWKPSTAYGYGDRIVPPVPAGRIYRCTLAGISGTTEPQFLIAPQYDGPVNPLAGAWWGAGWVPTIDTIAGSPWFFGLLDGTCAWRSYSIFTGELYDCRRATHDAWVLKASKASDRIRFSTDGQSFEDQQTYANCVAHARLYLPFGFA